MDRAAIDGLKQALAVSPDNLPLRLLLVRALFEAGAVAEACAQLRGATLESLAPTERALAGKVYLAADDAAAALAICGGTSPDELIIRARAHLALAQHRDGLAAHDKAVAANPALEDRELRKQLMAGLTDTAPAGAGNVVSFSVIRNEAREKDKRERPDEVSFLEPQRSKVTFAEVGGLAEVKKQIHRRIILPFQKPSLFQRFGRRAGGGVLLYGPPGCGKTLLARATAGECEAKFYSIAISDIFFVPPPDRPARESILRILLAERPVAADIDVAAMPQNENCWFDDRLMDACRSPPLYSRTNQRVGSIGERTSDPHGGRLAGTGAAGIGGPGA